MVATLTQKPMELEGNLKAFQLSDILRFLAMGKMTGLLTFLDKERAIELTIKDGTIAATASGDRFPRLGQMLVYSGLLSRKQLDEVLESQKDGATKMLGELLIEKGVITAEQLESAITLQIREQVWDLFSWTDGTFKFEHGLRIGSQRPLVTLEIEPLIEEGQQRLEQWRVISSTLGDPEQVFHVNPEVAALPQSRLAPNEWRVLSLINGRHPVQVLLYLSGLGRFETLCALDRLVAAQIVEALPGRPRAYDPGRLGEVSAPEPARSPSPEVITEVDEEDDESRPRGLFGRRRRAPRRETPAPVEDRRPQPRVGPFETPVGLACALVCRLAARLCAEPDFHSEGGAPALVEALWRELGMRFPRADLIVLREGRLDPAPYEAYVRLAGGIGGYLAGCHEDSMESLAQLGSRLARLGAERLGDRGRRAITETARPFLECTEIKFATDFSARLWAERWMEL